MLDCIPLLWILICVTTIKLNLMASKPAACLCPLQPEWQMQYVANIAAPKSWEQKQRPELKLDVKMLHLWNEALPQMVGLYDPLPDGILIKIQLAPLRWAPIIQRIIITNYWEWKKYTNRKEGKNLWKIHGCWGWNCEYSISNDVCTCTNEIVMSWA